jgi:CheY-like chemotaxis protein
MQIAEMDGVDLATIIQVKYPEIPIILLSSIGHENRKQYEQFFTHVLTKPVKQKVLSNAIALSLRKQRKDTTDVEIEKKLSTDFAKKYPLRILVAEDNPVNQTLALRVLKKLGFEPCLVENGILATKEINDRDYDIILMDVQMPEMDGLEATQVIRKNNQVQPIIIAMTANAMTEDREICLKAGMDDYISKPVKLEELVKILQKWALYLLNKQQTASYNQ